MDGLFLYDFIFLVKCSTTALSEVATDDRTSHRLQIGHLVIFVARYLLEHHYQPLPKGTEQFWSLVPSFELLNIMQIIVQYCNFWGQYRDNEAFLGKSSLMKCRFILVFMYNVEVCTSISVTPCIYGSTSIFNLGFETAWYFRSTWLSLGCNYLSGSISFFLMTHNSHMIDSNVSSVL